MSDHETPGFDADNDGSSAPRWTAMDLADMRQHFHQQIAPDAAQDGIDTDHEKPTYDWLTENGHRPFVTALRRNHDLAFDDFWSIHIADDITLSDYNWATTDGDTIEALEHFLDRRQSRYNLAESSVDTLRYRLNAYVRAFDVANDHARLLEPIARESNMPAYQAVDEVFAAFDHLNEAEDTADTTIARIADIVDAWYSHLVSRRLAAMNPASGLDDEFKWTGGGGSNDPPSLGADHVSALYEAADSREAQLFVVALAAWGLRANEVAELHVSQIQDLDADVPRIAFDERKNGPGSVSILYGVDVLETRLAQMSDRESWSGYLFPSGREDSDHVSRQTVWRRFQDLATDAGLPEEIDGERPSPQLCRRFWYDRYSETLEEVIAGLDEIAAEQGSSDPEVVLRNYLSEDRARRLRREAMREKLADAFK